VAAETKFLRQEYAHICLLLCTADATPPRALQLIMGVRVYVFSVCLAVCVSVCLCIAVTMLRTEKIRRPDLVIKCGPNLLERHRGKVSISVFCARQGLEITLQHAQARSIKAL
jgi:hypothetical protein